jgi:hypothetical protein
MRSRPDRAPHARVLGPAWRSGALWVPLILTVLAIGSPPIAIAQVFRCESESGVPEYTNTPRAKCRRLDLAPLTTIPAPPSKSSSSASSSATTAASTSRTASQRPGGSGDAALRIDPATQKARDADRRRILQDELAKEQARLDLLQPEIVAAEAALAKGGASKVPERLSRLREERARTEGNLKALNREISLLKD